MKEATFENEETAFRSVAEPTLTAEGMHAGALMAFVWPSFPAAIATAIPADRRLSMLGARESEAHGLAKTPPPRLMFAAAIE
jgi:hypothetical protein